MTMTVTFSDDISMATMRNLASELGIVLRKTDDAHTYEAVPAQRSRDQPHRADAHPLSEVAKSLGYGKLELFAALREKKILDPNNNPYPQYLREGLLISEIKSFTHPGTGARQPYMRTYATKKGIAWLRETLNATEQRGTDNDH